FLFGSDDQVAESNQAATMMFGYSTVEFRTLKKWDLLDHKSPGLLAAMQDSIKHGFAFTEATGIRKDGECFPVELTLSFFRNNEGAGNTCCMITDLSHQKRTEAALRLNKERYDLVIKATKDLVWDWDIESGEIYRNDSSLFDVYGLRSNRSIKTITDWSTYIHPDDKEKIMKMIDHYVHSAGETDFSFEYRFRQEDGSYAFISDKGYIIRNAKGKAIRMIGAAENITERKQQELAIKESEQRYRNFVQRSTEGIWRIELKERININAPLEEMMEKGFAHAFVAECNDAYAQMYGFNSAEELINIPLQKLWPKENALSVQYMSDFIRNGFKAREEISYEFNRNGEQVIFKNTMVGIVEDNYIGSVWGTRRNITDQVKAEKALAESEEHLRRLTVSNHQQITGAVITGQEKERTEIGQELHDNINQILASTKLYLECSLKDETPRRDLVVESKMLLEKAMKEIRKLSKSLLPPSLGEVGLLQALHELTEHIKQVNDLAIDIEWNKTDEDAIGSRLKLTIFRIVQEQLNNI
ncbi:MAG TPA: PAS domain S-box protein, partial [Ferruginibacter sp.]|nr:PAS domain S-box protein [Ferruginibacter sp.]